MPRYSYKCEACKEITTVFHLADERATDCSSCEAVDSLAKVLSNFRTPTRRSAENSRSAGRVTEEFIQDARQDLKTEKDRLKDER